MTFIDNLHEVGTVRYLGELGNIEPLTPTLLYNGRRIGYPPGLAVENIVRRLCNDHDLDFEAVTNPHAYLSNEQVVAYETMKRSDMTLNETLGDAISTIEANIKWIKAVIAANPTLIIPDSIDIDTTDMITVGEQLSQYRSAIIKVVREEYP
jgi:hypothetical protein